MTYRTHIVGGVLAALIATEGLGGIVMVGVVDTAIMVGVSAFASLVPDLDHEESKLGRRVPKVSKFLSRVFGHRGMTHAPIVYGLIYKLMQSQNIPMTITLGFLVGALSHLFLDMFNWMGVPLMLPLTKKKFSLGGIKTRSGDESVFCGGLVVGVVGMLANMLGVL